MSDDLDPAQLIAPSSRANDEAIVAQAIARAWEAGCPVAGGSGQLSAIALRRVRSIDRRRASPLSLDDRIEDLAKGLRDHLEAEPRLAGPLMTDYRYLARVIIEALDTT